MSNYYNYKDILKSPRIAVAPQRIFIATVGITLTHIVYFSGYYLSAVVSGMNVNQVWDYSGLFPFPSFTGFTFIGNILFLFTIIAASFMLLMMNTAISRAVYMHLRNNYFYSSKQAIIYAVKKAKTLFAVYFTFLFLIIPFILGAIIMAIIGRIDWVGEILNALATLPYIFSGMVLVFITLCFFIAFFLAPPIIASTDEDGFGTAVQCMHLTWGQPWRLMTYGILIFFLSIVGVFLFAFVLKIGLIIYSILFMPLMHSLSPILDHALFMIEKSIGSLDLFIRDLIGSTGAKMFYLKKDYLPVSLDQSEWIASIIVYVSLMVAGYMTLGYGMAVSNSGLTMSYIIFELKLSENNLLLRKDREVLEDQDSFEFNPKENTKTLGTHDK